MSQPSIAFYTSHSHLKNGGLYSESRIPGSYPTLPFQELKHEFERNGWSVYTYDQVLDPETLDVVVFLDLPDRPSHVARIRREARLASVVLYILESPPHNIGQFFIKNYSIFDAVVTYHRQHHDGERIYWCPIPCDWRKEQVSPYLPWKQRKHLIAVNTRKNAGFLCPSGSGWFYRLGIRGLGEPWAFSLRAFLRQWEGYKYAFRNSLIGKLDSVKPLGFEFDVYGANWDGTPVGYWERLFRKPPPLGSAKGVFNGNKQSLMSGYRYSLVIENWIGDEGYVSEKLYESLASGCIPIYWGDRSVYRMLPTDIVIRGDSFKDACSLVDFIQSESEETWQSRLTSLITFLNSSEFEAVTPSGFARRFSAAIYSINRRNTAYL